MSAEDPEAGDYEVDRPTLQGNALNGNALNGNALNGNALNGNSLHLDAFGFETLHLDALSFDALEPEAQAMVQSPGTPGDLARELLRYIVSCAFDPSESLSFSWTDSDGTVRSEAYEGLLGLTPQWLNGPLVTSEARWISACLASRVNWYGVSVLISSRGNNPGLDVTDDELALYPLKEGAFWGDLFSPTPAVYACYDSGGVDHARALHRDCAAGHVNSEGQVSECGPIQIVGDCNDVCSPAHPLHGYHAHCSSGPGAPDSSSRVLTVFLQQ